MTIVQFIEAHMVFSFAVLVVLCITLVGCFEAIGKGIAGRSERTERAKAEAEQARKGAEEARDIQARLRGPGA